MAAQPQAPSIAQDQSLHDVLCPLLQQHLQPPPGDRVVFVLALPTFKADTPRLSDCVIFSVPPSKATFGDIADAVARRYVLAAIPGEAAAAQADTRARLSLGQRPSVVLVRLRVGTTSLRLLSENDSQRKLTDWIIPQSTAARVFVGHARIDTRTNSTADWNEGTQGEWLSQLLTPQPRSAEDGYDPRGISTFNKVIVPVSSQGVVFANQVLSWRASTDAQRAAEQ